MDFLKSVLIIGSGGREHALLKAMLRSDEPMCMFAWPGNPGMESDGCIIVDKQVETLVELADWALENNIDLTVVGPEIPLVDGIVDIFNEKGLTIFGPTKSAARIEGSKVFSKNLMKKYGIPTAGFEVFSDKKSALEYLEKKGAPIVIKASGLAAGKGAVVCNTMEEAVSTLKEMFDDKIFGDAATEVVLEEKMVGEEASVFALCDGKTFKVLPVSQDHKAAFDGDKGPNTGGMGAYAPAPLITKELLRTIEETIIEPTLEAMKSENAEYRGLLYVGVMITPEGPKVVEYNCRFGDPETQAVLPLVECNWFEVFSACAKGNLSRVDWSIRDEFCATIVLASGGYPGSYKKGIAISGIYEADHSSEFVDVYHAGTALDEKGDFVTNGGRVLAVSGWKPTLEDAIAEAYVGAAMIDFEGKMFRRDIGAKGLVRLKS